jgi:hypothetical protein
MGVDFLKRVGKSFHKALDRGAVALRTPQLMGARVQCVNRSALGQVVNDAAIVTGETVIIRLRGDRLVCQRGTEVVIRFDTPPADFANHVRDGAGVEIGEVTKVHPLSGTVEVSFCD